MHMHTARKIARKTSEKPLNLKGEMCFATETRLADTRCISGDYNQSVFLCDTRATNSSALERNRFERRWRIRLAVAHDQVDRRNLTLQRTNHDQS
jgi:hypothetical protein